MPYISRPYFASLDALKQRTLAAAHTSFGWHPETHDGLLVPNSDRYSGTYVSGVQGYGKSRLMQNLIVADMNAGHGVIVIDAHGDLLINCLSQVPGSRLRG